MAFLKTKKSFPKSDSGTEVNVFPKYIVIESMDKTPQNKLSLFLFEKVMIGRANPKFIKNIRNRKLLVEVTEKNMLTTY